MCHGLYFFRIEMKTWRLISNIKTATITARIHSGDVTHTHDH